MARILACARSTIAAVRVINRDARRGRQALGACVCRSPCASLVPRARRAYAPGREDPLLVKAYNAAAKPARGHDGGDVHMAGTLAELRRCACMRCADGRACMDEGFASAPLSEPAPDRSSEALVYRAPSQPNGVTPRILACETHAVMRRAA